MQKIYTIGCSLVFLFLRLVIDIWAV